MQFLTSLFGGSGNTVVTTLFALGIVLVLIVAGVWLLKLVFRASGNIGRGRNRRLTLVDTMNVDPKRQLLIVRRDNVEHLILTGGPQDLVVETGIPVEKPVAPVRRPVPGPLHQDRRPAHPSRDHGHRGHRRRGRRRAAARCRRPRRRRRARRSSGSATSPVPRASVPPASRCAIPGSCARSAARMLTTAFSTQLQAHP